jgi:hypothetical protein
MEYQNGEHAPLQVADSSIASGRTQTTRRLFFTGGIIALLLAFGVLAGLVVHIQNGPSSILPEAVATNALNKLDDLSSSSSLLAGCESTILILRHCEKEGPSVADNHGNQHCSYLGQERAHFLPSLFGVDKWPFPSLLYALSDDRGGHVNDREIETLTPLANKLGLEINSQFRNNRDMTEDYFTQVSSGNLCGQTTVVSWEHSVIPDLAQTLGCTDCPGVFPEQYDPVWQLKFVYNVLGTNIVQEHHDAVSIKKGKKQVHGDRKLKKKRQSHSNSNSSRPQWTVFSTVTSQNFDPLKFSHISGDYEGSPKGGKWMSPQEEL